MPPGFEELHAYIAAQLARPVSQDFADDGSVVLTSGDPCEVIVRLTKATVTVAEYSIRSTGPHAPFVAPIVVGTVKWRRVSPESAMHAVKSLIVAARDSRLAKFRTCQTCSERNPPEWMYDDELCQACAESRFGVVH